MNFLVLAKVYILSVLSNLHLSTLYEPHNFFVWFFIIYVSVCTIKCVGVSGDFRAIVYVGYDRSTETVKQWSSDGRHTSYAGYWWLSIEL